MLVIGCFRCLSRRAIQLCGCLSLTTSSSESLLLEGEVGGSARLSTDVVCSCRLSAFQDVLLQWLKANPKAVIPVSRYNEVNFSVLTVSLVAPASQFVAAVMPCADCIIHRRWIDRSVCVSPHRQRQVGHSRARSHRCITALHHKVFLLSLMQLTVTTMLQMIPLIPFTCGWTL